jgi:catechol 2,3-dioxygenase-like lactoylglutathione lyase family enzyme
MISHIDHIVLTVADIERSVAFYTRVLRMEPVTFAGGRRALKFGTQKINLQTLGQEPRNHAAVGSGDLCLITRWPLADAMAHLAAQDVPLLEGPVTKSGACGPIESVYFNDPDGNLVEVSVYPGAAAAA